MTGLGMAELEQWLAGFLPILLRITPFVTALPIFSQNIPLPVKICLSLWLAMILNTTLPRQYLPQALADITPLLVAQQVLIGLALGFVLRFAHAAVQVGGHLIGQQMGLGFAALQDPQNGAQTPQVSRFYTILMTLLFLAIDGHLVLLRILVESFTSLPVTGGGLSPLALRELALWGGTLFTGAMALALPTVTALLLVNLAFGVITRATPQLNILVVGFPVTLGLGFLLMLLSIPVATQSIRELIRQSLELTARLAG